MVDFMKDIVVPAILQELVSRAISFALEKRKEKVLQGEFLKRIQTSVNDMEIALERTRKLPITDISLLRRRQEIVDAFTKGRHLLTRYEQQQKLKNQPVTRYSVRESITGHAIKFSFLPLLGFSKERLLSSSDAREFERHADTAAKFIKYVGSPRDLSFCCPFVGHLLKGKSLRCEIVKNRSQSIRFDMQPFIVEGRGVEVILMYDYNDSRKLKEYILIALRLRISEDTNIIRTTIECMQQLTSLFKLTAKTAIEELKLLPDLQDSFHTYDHPSSFVSDLDATFIKRVRHDPICCTGNSYGTLANKSSMEIPEPVNWVYIRCHISAPRNSLRNAPLLLTGFFEPHDRSKFNGRILASYGDKSEGRNGSVQQLEEIVRSEGVNYLVQEPEPTAYNLIWWSPHGSASVVLYPATPRRSRKVSKRKR